MTFEPARVPTLAKDIFNQVKEGEVQLVAGSLAFSTILGIVPLIALILSIIQYFNGFESFYPKIENLILGVFKEAAGAEAIRVMKYSIRNIHLGAIGTTGAVFLVITSIRLLADMEYGINRVWNLRAKRSILKRFFFYQVILVFVPFFLVVAFSVARFKSQWVYADWMPKESLTFLFLFVFLYTVNKMVPVIFVPPRFAALGAFFSCLGVIGVHKGFVFIAKTFFSYNKIYGAVAALPILLLWLLGIWNVLLAGAALTAALTHRDKPKVELYGGEDHF